MPPTIRPIRPEELAAWLDAFNSAFYVWASDAEAAAEFRRPRFEFGRALGAFDGDEVVGTFRSFRTLLTLPGGARVPVGAVSAVSVRPTHRRRGILRRMIAEDLGHSSERDEVANILIAAEWPIYGRFGYGPATWKASWLLSPRGMTFLTERHPGAGTIEIVTAKRARELLPGIFAECAAAQPGEIDRTDQRWDVDLGLVEVPGRPRWRGSIAVHRDATGHPDGYAMFHGEERWGEGGKPEHRMLLDELHGVTEAVELDLWQHLARMDLTAEIKAEVRREHEPLAWHLADARVIRSLGASDFLWLRPLDVPGLLGARRYERDGTLVLEVLDVVNGATGPAAGRYRLDVRDGMAAVERTKAKPELTLEARHLGAASLGGTRLVDAARAAGATEHRPGALRDADLLLLTAEPPWCSTWF